jgi:hypothetical protein
MPQEKSVGSDVIVALAVAAVLTGLGLLIEDTFVGLVLAVIIIPAMIYAAARSPLRYSLMLLMFLGLALPNPQEGIPTYEWLPPFIPLGKLFLDHLNTFDHKAAVLSFASFSGMDLCLMVLGIIAFYRKSTGSKIDSVGRLRTPLPLVHLAWLSLASMAFEWLLGMVTGGDFAMSLWQISAVVYTPLVFLLFQTGVRGPSDLRGFAKVLLAAATYKALLAIYVRHFVVLKPDPETLLPTILPYATSHADSILFADAFLLIIALLLEKEKIKLMAAVLLPILAIGMIENNRRLVWVQVALVLLTVFIVSKDNSVKRFLRRYLRIAVPVMAIYVAAGWNSGGGMTYKPVRMLRSVVDTKSDGSSFWRELENFNLLVTMRHNLFFGTGYGHPYEEAVAMPEVPYPLERYVPHNSIFGLWAYCGLVGYAGLTMIWTGGVYFAMRAYHGSRKGQERAAALVSFGAILVWLIQCWGDLGLGLWAGVFTVAPALAVSGKLAVAAGEWNPKALKGKGMGAQPTSPQT